MLYCDGTSFDVLYGDVVSSGIPFKPDLGEPSCPTPARRPERHAPVILRGWKDSNFLPPAS